MCRCTRPLRGYNGQLLPLPQSSELEQPIN
uniref:Uncharacterized protein n=1 Tax=Anguilla anguilla TaxID=7936 RepID=A0A0E9XBB6_ANGAN